jgi:hypothetical protein
MRINNKLFNYRIKRTSKLKEYAVTQRLDESLPLETSAWKELERNLVRLTEFAPKSLLLELTTAIAYLADEQARQGYMLGQEDLILQLNEAA